MDKPVDHVSLERQKAIARRQAFQSRYQSAVSSIDLEYIHKVNTAFSKKHVSDVTKHPGGSHSVPSISGNHTAPREAVLTGFSHTGQASGAVSSSGSAIPADTVESTSPAGAPVPNAVPHSQVPSEPDTAYTVQRGSFELRVTKGELSYVPPLVMTIITQYPEVQFEYTGGFNYIPSRDDSPGTNMNLSI